MMLTKLQSACKYGDYEGAAKAIFVDKEDVDGDSYYSPLYAACENGHMDIVQLLVTCGVDVNKKYGRKHMTALHSACANGEEVSVRNLLTIPAIDINIKDRYGDAPIHDYMNTTNNTKGEIYNMITSRPEFDWECKDNRGFSFQEVIDESNAVIEWEMSKVNKGEDEIKDKDEDEVESEDEADNKVIANIFKVAEQEPNFICVCGNNLLVHNWNACDRCDDCCDCNTKCNCDDKHCEGDCGVMPCGSCVDVCRCGFDGDWRD